MLVRVEASPFIKYESFNTFLFNDWLELTAALSTRFVISPAGKHVLAAVHFPHWIIEHWAQVLNL